jgi:hypothetical protein
MNEKQACFCLASISFKIFPIASLDFSFFTLKRKISDLENIVALLSTRAYIWRALLDPLHVTK